ncbi:hypothetical protein GE115_09975 [Agromyces sp. CFH 90414]|uniref:Uncharacterized protein n=1 Tax=Agromyces agglutinans TaxID=2662258 RepID=A0A6I2F666_9MICO|nr:hypothetical protein [Agromyces agglutinans]MRG60192.1 hypothetical protein [Agromyces agglutinans]
MTRTATTPMTTTTGPAATGVPRRSSAAFIVVVLAIGLLSGAAALFASGAGGVAAELPMTAVGIAVLGYLAAAATGIRWMAWLWGGLAGVLVVLAELVDLQRWLVLAAGCLVFAVIGLVRRPVVTVPQALAAVGYFGVAVLALLLEPRVGLIVGGLALASHAVWDLVHYRRDIVVNRSLALWCMGLDLVAGLGCVGLAIVG